jgi:dipeptidase
MEVLRLGLERGRTAADAVEVMTEAITRYGQGKFANEAGVRTYDNGYLVADPREAYVIETAGHHWAVKRVERTVGISNVYSVQADWQRLSPDAAAFAKARGWPVTAEGPLDFTEAFADPACRFGVAQGDRRRIRSCAVLGQRDGEITAGTMMALLRDHSDAATPDEPFRTDFTHRTGI